MECFNGKTVWCHWRFCGFWAAAMAISEGRFCKDDSGTRQAEIEPLYQPPGPPPPPPPKPEDNIRMPYCKVIRVNMHTTIYT